MKSLTQNRRHQVKLQHAIRAAAQQAAQELGHWTPITHTRTPTTETIDLMTQPGKPPMTRYRKRRDGTIHAYRNGTEVSHLTITPDHIDLTTLARWLQGKIISQAAKTLPDPEDLVLALYPSNGGSPLLDTLHDCIGAILQENTTAPGAQNTHKYPNWPKRLPPNIQKAQKETDSLLILNFLDLRVLDLLNSHLKSRHSSPYIIPNNYNWAALNAKTIAALDRATPGITLYYTHLLLDPIRKAARLHPGQIVAAVKAHTGMTKPQWKAFCRLNPALFLHRLINRSPQEMESNLHDIRLLCEAVAQANRPKAPPDYLGLLERKVQASANYAAANPTALSPWKAWVNILNGYLNGQDHPRQDSYTQFANLSYIEDCFRQHVENDLPWTPADWQTLHHRARRWHQEIQNRHSASFSSQPWPNALPAYADGDLNIEPVTNPKALHQLAKAMGNCLETYIPNCLRNRSRIFTISKHGRLMAAAEIVNDSGRWFSGQLEGPHRGQIPGIAHEAASRIPALYAQAEKELNKNRPQERPHDNASDNTL